MRVISLALALAAASAATNSRSASGSWFSSTADWSLARFPRHTDEVKLSAAVTFDGTARPAYYNGATEGDVIDLGDEGVLDIVDQSTVTLGPQANPPVNCAIGAWGSFTKCSKACNTGSQTRARTNVEPTFGGDVCPTTNEQTQKCNIQACGCASGKQHGEKYTGFGKNYCNQCKCHNGKDVCEERACNVHSTAKVCSSTKCTYGVLFTATQNFMSITKAFVKYGGSWANKAHEMTTLVKHDLTDKNGKTFHCGHVRDTTDTCKCYCSNSGGRHIWHHAKRHAKSITLGHTAALCDCQKNWTNNGKIFNGCQNPAAAGEPARYGGTKPHSWCKIVAGSCHGAPNAIPAGSDWDTCETHTMWKLKIPSGY